MRATATSIGLAIFLGLATAQSSYDTLCNSPPSGEQEVDSVNEPGLMATYGCGKFHKAVSNAGGHQTATSPKECAMKCAARNPEGPCTWYENDSTCYFYIQGADTDDYNNAVTIDIRKDWDKLRAAYATCDSDLNTCQHGGGGPPIPGPPIPGPPTPGPLPGTCPGQGQVIHAAGKQWTAHCDKRATGNVGQLSTGNKLGSPQECAEYCDKVNSYKSRKDRPSMATYRPGDNNCNCHYDGRTNHLDPDVKGIMLPTPGSDVYIEVK